MWKLTSSALHQSICCVISRETEANIRLDLSCGCSSLCMCVREKREDRPAPRCCYSNTFDSPYIKCKAACVPVWIYDSTTRMTGWVHKRTCSSARWQDCDNVIDWVLRNMCKAEYQVLHKYFCSKWTHIISWSQQIIFGFTSGSWIYTKNPQWAAQQASRRKTLSVKASSSSGC